MGCISSIEDRLYVKQLENITPLGSGNDIEILQPQFSKYTLLKSNDYCNDMIPLSDGGSGKVYSGFCKSKNRRFALKLFGYHERITAIDDVFSEIEKLHELRDVDGVVRYEGIIMDTAEGIIPNKIHTIPYPIIVMELLEGGELFHKIHHRVSVSEYDIARMFREIAVTISNIHDHGFIHRDIKLENLMLVNDQEDSPIKLIDFDLMVRLPTDGDGVYRGYTINGSAGYVAPESILYYDYSTLSDTWQLGCVLYIMLSGLQPFDPEDTTQQTFFPMIGDAWDSISDSAKCLVREMLNRNPKYRISIGKVLQSSWVCGEAPRQALGEPHKRRLRHLALRQQLRAFFTDCSLRGLYFTRKDKLRDVVPLLLASGSMTFGNDPIDEGGGGGQSPFFPTQESSDVESLIGEMSRSEVAFSTDATLSALTHLTRSVSSDTGNDWSPWSFSQEPLPSRCRAVLKHCKTMKVMLLNTVTSTAQPEAPQSVVPAGGGSSTVGDFNSGGSLDHRACTMSYADFAPVYARLELPQHSFNKVCHLFDTDNSGHVDVKAFLVTMISLRREVRTGRGSTPCYSHNTTDSTLSPGQSPVYTKACTKFSVESPHRASFPLSPAHKEHFFTHHPSATITEEPPFSSPKKRKPSLPPSHPKDDIIRLYFDIFDVDEDGYIEMEDISTVVQHLIGGDPDYSDWKEDDLTLSPLAKDLFSVMNKDSNRKIDFDDFSVFFRTLLEHPTLRRT